MNIINELRNNILENNFKMIYNDKKITITNYLNIPVFDNKEIHVKYKEGIIKISGNDLVISKLIKDEILITGCIIKIEFINE